MGLFSLSRTYFSLLLFFFPQMGRFQAEKRRSISFTGLVSAMLICFVKTKLRTPAQPLLRHSRGTLN